MYQTGLLKSIHKIVRVNADDSNAVMVKNLGNGRRIPFLWATQVTMASGVAEVVIASGVAFSNLQVGNAMFSVTPHFTGNPDSTAHIGKTYVQCDTTNNIATLKSTAGAINYDTTYDVYVFMGDAATYTASDSNMLWKSSGTNRMG